MYNQLYQGKEENPQITTMDQLHPASWRGDTTITQNKKNNQKKGQFYACGDTTFYTQLCVNAANIHKTLLISTEHMACSGM